MFAIICSIGAVVTAVSPSFPVMAAGPDLPDLAQNR
jgi:hypothetical protein